MCVLGSGSSGNCSIVRAGGTVVMIDAGFGPRSVAQRLAGTGVHLHDIRALLLTHLDHDHFKPTWFGMLQRLGIRVYVHQRHVHALYQRGRSANGAVDAHALHREGLLLSFDDRPFSVEGNGGALRVSTVRAAHDGDGTVSFRLDTPTGALSYATDLGRVTTKLIKAMTDVDLLAIESNYDPPMQMSSARPAMLKRRIMGGRGHLSNQEALTAVRQAVGVSKRPPQHVVLLHLSRQCNCPDVVRRMYADDPALAERLCVSTQQARTPWLRAPRTPAPIVHEQLPLLWNEAV